MPGMLKIERAAASDPAHTNGASSRRGAGAVEWSNPGGELPAAPENASRGTGIAIQQSGSA